MTAPPGSPRVAAKAAARRIAAPPIHGSVELPEAPPKKRAAALSTSAAPSGDHSSRAALISGDASILRRRVGRGSQTPYTRPEDLVIHLSRPQPVSPRLNRLVPVLVAACASLAVFAAPAPAATPCWKLLLNDWYDGAINNTYPIPCYQQAIDHLPTDVDVYSSAREDIQRALQQAISKEKQTGTTVTNIEPGTSEPGRTTTSTTPST